VTTTERDFPYSPTADATKLYGLDKLRAVEDRRTAAYLHDLYVRFEPAWRAAEARDSEVFPEDFSAFDAVRPPEAGTAARALWERENAVVYHAWQEWAANLETYKADYLQRTGRELSRDQVAAHRDRFGKIMRRKYGRAFADERWVEEHNAWQERR